MYCTLRNVLIKSYYQQLTTQLILIQVLGARLHKDNSNVNNIYIYKKDHYQITKNIDTERTGLIASN